MNKIELAFFVAVIIALLALITFTPAHASLHPDARVPILLYHSRHVDVPCDYGSNDLLALERDLETLHAEGYTVVPVERLVDWQAGRRRGDTLPDKPVGITLDDGFDADYIDRTANAPECGPHKSAHTILREFKDKYADELPDYSPHATVFVIASREVRMLLEDNHFQHNWWAAAHHSPLMSVQNHGSDHDHTVITEPLWDEGLSAWLPASASADNVWEGKLNPRRNSNLESNRIHITDAAQYIADRTGEWPIFFAHPMGLGSDYARRVYFPGYYHEHGTTAAFCTEIAGRGPQPGNYMTRKSERWCLPRLTHGFSWRNEEEFLAILEGAAN